MAQKVTVVLVDDLDGSEASETVTFALDGKSYEIDLTEAHAKQFRDDMSRWVASARKASGTSGGAQKGPRSARGTGRQSEAAKMRAWALEQGLEVPSRGRVPNAVQDAYAAAN